VHMEPPDCAGGRAGAGAGWGVVAVACAGLEVAGRDPLPVLDIVERITLYGACAAKYPGVPTEYSGVPRGTPEYSGVPRGALRVLPCAANYPGAASGGCPSGWPTYTRVTESVWSRAPRVPRVPYSLSPPWAGTGPPA
jgi:hypothetical protein